MKSRGPGPAPGNPGDPQPGALPLRGIAFLNTREGSSAPELTRRLTELGAEVVEQPMLRFAPPGSWEPFDRRLEVLQAGDWMVFTSATAVRFVVERLRELGVSAKLLAGARVAAVGPATAEALVAQGITPELVPGNFQAEGLLEALAPRLGRRSRVWLPRAEKGREILAEGLAQAGHEVALTPVYRTEMPEGGLGPAAEALRAGRLDWLVFTSSSTVTHFLAMAEQEGLRITPAGKPRVACLGAVTAETARSRGLEVAVTPRRQDLDGLVAALVAVYQEKLEPPSGEKGGKNTMMVQHTHGSSGMSEDPAELATLRQRALQFLVHSFLYYRLEEPVVTDGFFDRITEELRLLREKHPTAEMPFSDLIDPQLGPEASGFRIRDYPPQIVSTAFKLLYAASNPELDFSEFAEQRGYRALIHAKEPS